MFETAPHRTRTVAKYLMFKALRLEGLLGPFHGVISVESRLARVGVHFVFFYTTVRIL